MLHTGNLWRPTDAKCCRGLGCKNTPVVQLRCSSDALGDRKYSSDLPIPCNRHLRYEENGSRRPPCSRPPPHIQQELLLVWPNFTGAGLWICFWCWWIIVGLLVKQNTSTGLRRAASFRSFLAPPHHPAHRGSTTLSAKINCSH